MEDTPEYAVCQCVDLHIQGTAIGFVLPVTPHCIKPIEGFRNLRHEIRQAFRLLADKLEVTMPIILIRPSPLAISGNLRPGQKNCAPIVGIDCHIKCSNMRAQF